MLRNAIQLLPAFFIIGGASLFGQGNFKATLSGYDEVPTLSTTGSGTVAIHISKNPDLITVKLTFTNLEGVASASHFHIGKPAINGGVAAFICGGSKPSCPATPDGTVTTTIAANDVVAVPAQGIAAGDIAALIRAIENGAVYANLHTNIHASGEIRGQVARGNGRGPGNGNNGNGHGNGKNKGKGSAEPDEEDE